MWVGREQFLNFEVHKELLETLTPAAWNITIDQRNKTNKIKFQAQSLLTKDKNEEAHKLVHLTQPLKNPVLQEKSSFAMKLT